MRVHWSICLRISFEAAAPPISQSLATRAVWDRYCCMDPENRSGTLVKSTWSSRYTEKKLQDQRCSTLSFKAKIQCTEVNTRRWCSPLPVAADIGVIRVQTPYASGQSQNKQHSQQGNRWPHTSLWEKDREEKKAVWLLLDQFWFRPYRVLNVISPVIQTSFS